jgi:hypothetical protein
MAVPVAPSVTTLCTEAFRRCGIAAPTVAQLTRAEDEWFEEVKRDLTSRKTWHSNEETLVVIPQAYLQVYAMPTPLIRIQRMRFYRGTTTGLATAGGSNTITIASGMGNTQHKGRKIFLVSGTGAAQAGRITNVAGDVYTISCTWDTVPVAGTGYMIADTEQMVIGPEHGFALDGRSPSTMLVSWDFVEHNLRFWPALDNAGQYALEIDGAVDLSLVDRTDGRLVRLLREWREPLVRGVMVRIKEDQDDPDVDRDERKYEKAIVNTMKQDGRKRLRGEAPVFRSVGGFARRRR